LANPVDTAGVADPPPQAVYQALATANGGAGQRLSYSIPVPDGNYTVRLHFAEPSLTRAGDRKFDVVLQGPTAHAGYDIHAAAGGRLRAAALGFAVTAAGGAGISLDLVNVTSNPAVLAGVEVLAANPAGVAAPTADVELSADGGLSWATLASGVPMDRFG